MLSAFLSLILCQLVGELIREALDLPVPGPVIGMFLLVAVLGWRANGRDEVAVPKQLEALSEGLIRRLGLLFIPAGVGIIAEIGVLRQDWLPIIVGVLGSTILSVVTTGLVMHWVIRKSENRPDDDKAISLAKTPAE